MIFLLEDINIELNDNINNKIYQQFNYSNKISKQLSNIEFDLFFKKRQNSIIIDLFYTQIVTTLTCNCGKSNFYFQKIIDIPLLIPTNKNKIKFKELLNLYFATEFVEVTYSCEFCKKHNKFEKKLRISMAPIILIFTIQRFDYINNIKNDCKIEISETLSIDDYVDKECINIKENIYNLYGVINHYGSLNFGHYNSLIKIDKTNKWILFDDKLVKSIEFENNLFNNCYILIYLKK